MIPRNTLYRGTNRPPTPAAIVRAGPLAAVFENGMLRTISLGDHEVVRRIYVALRDRNWAPVPIRLAQTIVQADDDSFTISFEATHQRGEVDFAWRGEIIGRPSGEIAFTLNGVARSSFWRSRIGFCVLLPLRECAGQPCTVQHADGPIIQGAFPSAIAPHPRFVEMQGISFPLTQHIEAELIFAGDRFEMEDQRNWIDGSYKCYSTPLRLPYPVEIPAGTRIQQSVTLRLNGTPRVASSQTTPAEPAVRFATSPGPRLPQIGIGMASHGSDLTTKEAACLARLRPAHLRVDLRPSTSRWQDALQQATVQAQQLDAGLEIALHLTDDAESEIRAVDAGVRTTQSPVNRWLVYHDRERAVSRRWVELARDQLESVEPRAQFGGGTNLYFAEINRVRPPLEILDVVTFSANPQVHAFDDTTLIESLEGLRAVLENAHRVSEGRPVGISPLTLRARFRPVLTGPEPPLGPNELPPQVDPRQMSLFGAGWLMGALSAAAESALHSLTCFETTGWRGVMEREAGSARPDLFASVPGAVFPVYFVLAWLREFAGGQSLSAVINDARRVAALGMTRQGEHRTLVANLSPEPVRVHLSGLPGQVRLLRLDENNAEWAMTHPEAYLAQSGEGLETDGGALTLEMLPYALARADGRFG